MGKNALTWEDLMNQAYRDIRREIERRNPEHGVYLVRYKNENWLVLHNKEGLAIGEPMKDNSHGFYEGWFTYEFDNEGNLLHAEPMFYADLGEIINRINGVI